MTAASRDSAWEFSEAGLHVQASSRSDDGVLDAFYPAYDGAFVLANEKEGIAGFRDCLALNDGPDHQALQGRYGDFREMLLVMRDRAGGEVLGGANLLVLQPAAQMAASIGYTANLNYLFVDPAQRGKRLSRHLMSACRRVASRLAQQWNANARASGLKFLEINDPFRLTPEQYRLDSEHAGIDQIERLAYWARMGARIVDWPYVQPALSAGQGDDDTLAFGVIDAAGAHLPASWLLHHLERFFAISVLKGASLTSSSSAEWQLAQLCEQAARREDVALLDLRAASPSAAEALAREGSTRPANLPDALKTRS